MTLLTGGCWLKAYSDAFRLETKLCRMLFNDIAADYSDAIYCKVRLTVLFVEN